MVVRILKRAWDDKVAIGLGTVLSILFVTYIMSLIPPFTVVEQTVQPVVVKAGDTINVCRSVDYKYVTDVSVRRALVRWDPELNTNRVLGITSNAENIPRERGVINICRDVTIPAKATPSDDWVLITYVKIRTLPFWVRTFEILPLPVTVIK